jgi:hypothetical protein
MVIAGSGLLDQQGGGRFPQSGLGGWMDRMLIHTARERSNGGTLETRSYGSCSYLNPAFDHCVVLIDGDFSGLTEVGDLYV